MLLSALAGASPWFIAIVLILCNAGFSFLQSSLAHTVSGTLPREQMGIGMGMYNLVMFMSGAFSAAIIGKLLDLAGGRGVPLAAAQPSATPYSLLFLLLCGIVIAAAVVFHTAFRGKAGGTT